MFLVVLLALAMAGFVEIFLGFPLTTGMTLLYGLVCSFLFVPFVLLDRSVPKLFLIACFYLGLSLVHLIPWNIRKPFLKDLRSVRPGMTVEQVDMIMERWTIDSASTNLNWLGLPEGEDFILYRPGEVEKRFQADYGLVRFHEGRVRNVRFGRE